jgi:penicillin-insensitive murein DD-endopeptidase
MLRLARALLLGLLGAVVGAFLFGCGRTPTPIAPRIGGSVGVPHRGVLTDAAMLPPEGEGFKWLRQDERHYGIPRFVAAIERAAAKVARERPGAMLAIGDLSMPTGGQLLPHISHRTGRDADLLLYLVTLDGAPVESPGFIHVGTDGLAWDEKGKRFLRLDIERQWLLVKALVEDPGARVQWLFASRHVRAQLIEWARARGESPETIVRAMEVMLQPQPGGPHDDHLHVRTACSPAELVSGCEHTGPRRAWIDAADAAFEAAFAAAPDDDELALEIFTPLEDASRANASASR